MDVFSSALKNPLPPARKKFDHKNDGSASSSSQNVSPEAATNEEANRTVPVEAPVASSQYTDQQISNDNKKKNSRRRHRNSHLGCGICKKRRIKCDEHLPQCYNCLKGRLHCAYLNLDATARNALRLAQYNQNLRDERASDSPPKQTEKSMSYTGASNEGPPQPPSYPSVMNAPSEPLSIYANNPASTSGNPQLLTSNRRPSTAANSVPPAAMAPPVPGPPSMMQSMYVPVVQLQPVNPGMSYTQLPMQMIAGQQPPPIVYQSEQMAMMSSQPMPVAPNAQSIMYYPAQGHGSNPPYDPHAPGYMMPVQRQYGPGLIHENGTYYQESQKPEITVQAPKANVHSPPMVSQSLSVPSARSSSGISPVTAYANSDPSPVVPSIIHPESTSANTTSSKDLDLPSVGSTGSLSNATSSGTSPSLPAISSVSGDKSLKPTSGADMVKLAPIQVKVEEKKDVASQPEMAPNDEKISSIKMLLS